MPQTEGKRVKIPMKELIVRNKQTKYKIFFLQKQKGCKALKNIEIQVDPIKTNQKETSRRLKGLAGVAKKTTHQISRNVPFLTPWVELIGKSGFVPAFGQILSVVLFVCYSSWPSLLFGDILCRVLA